VGAGGAVDREAFAAADISYELKPKDGTFYAPKIDIYIDDALGREWQMATIQIDLTMLPERFDLTYIDEEGKPAAADRHPSSHLRLPGAVHRDPHRAFRGGVPAVARAGPGGRHPDRGPARPGGGAIRRGAARARASGVGGRIVQPHAVQDPDGAGTEVPYMVVLGDREIEARTASPRTRSGEQQPAEDWDAFAERLATESRERTVA
jgi:threonyl-tRNA synthetase